MGNTKLSGNQWEDWMQQWINYAQPKDGFSWDGWFAGGKAQLTMESDLSTFVSKNVIFPGRRQRSNKPGSNVLFVKQYQIKTDLWNRQFFCESMTTVSGTWKIVEADSSCYLESGSSSVSV